MTRSIPNSAAIRRHISMMSSLQELAPEVATMALFAFAESQRQRWLPRGVTLDAWLISAIWERTALLIDHGILGEVPFESLLFSLRPRLEGDCLLYLTPSR